jgi:cell division protein FtsL
MKIRLNPVLAASLMLCAMFLVNSQYQARRLFIELERAQTQFRQLEVEKKELELKQSTLAQHARIESSARRELSMVTLKPDSTLYLTAGAK